MIMVYFLLLMEILYLLTLKRNETCKANIRCVFSSQNCKFKAGAVYCIYWVADFYFVLRITLYRLYSSISRGGTTHTHTHCGKLTLLSVVDVFFSMVRILMFSRSDGPKWSYFRTCVFNPCVNFASKGNSCSYYKRYIFEGLKLNRNIIYTWYKTICIVYLMY
jgi:hypothetical protein